MATEQEVQEVMDSKGLSFQDALEYIDVKNGGTGGIEAVSQEDLIAEAQALFQEREA